MVHVTLDLASPRLIETLDAGRTSESSGTITYRHAMLGCPRQALFFFQCCVSSLHTSRVFRGGFRNPWAPIIAPGRHRPSCQDILPAGTSIRTDSCSAIKAYTSSYLLFSSTSDHLLFRFNLSSSYNGQRFKQGRHWRKRRALVRAIGYATKGCWFKLCHDSNETPYTWKQTYVHR